MGGGFKAKKKASAGGGKGYSAFVADEYAAVKKEGVPANEAFKAIGERWRKLSDSEKARYSK